MDVPLLLAFIAGLVSFMSPCVLPLVPAYIGYMGGQVTHTLAARASGGAAALPRPTLAARLTIVLHSLAFVLGFTVVFVTLGLISTVFVQAIGRQNISYITGLISRAGGLLIILFGLHFMGALAALFQWLLAQPKRLNSPAIAIGAAALMFALVTWVLQDWLPAVLAAGLLVIWLVVGGAFSHPAAFWVKAIEGLQTALYADTRRQREAAGEQSYWGSFTMGIVFSAGWTPCIGPIYGAILTMAASGGDVGQAGVQLAAYSLGLGVPFVLTAMLLDGAGALLKRLQRNMRLIEIVVGLFLVFIGVLVATERLQQLSQNFAVQFADFSYRLEECTIDLYDGAIDLGGFTGCMGAADEAAAG